MRTRNRSAILALLVLTAVIAGPARDARAAEYGWAVTFQGEVKNGGVPMNGTASMVFKLYDAASGGTQVGQTIAQSSVTVTNGVFTTDLDFTNGGIIPGVYDGQERWLDIAVNGTPLSPRQRLAPAPHAAISEKIRLPFRAATDSSIAIEITGNANADQTRLLRVVNNSANIGAISIFGEHNTVSNEGFGVYGISHSSNGFGLGGTNDSPTGNCTGIYGTVASPDGFAISGIAFSPTGPTKGIYGAVSSASGWAGYFVGRGHFSQEVGIGTTNPQFGMHVIEPTNLAIGAESPSTIGTWVGIRNTSLGGRNYALIASGSANGEGAGKLMFFDATSGLTRMVLDSGGDLGIGLTNPTFDLHLANNSAAKPTSSAWTISSDRRLKKNIEPIEDALDRLMRLRGVTYQWKKPETQGNMKGTYTGMIAQDVEKVFPEWITEDEEGYKRLTVIGFEGIAVEALRELRAEKDAQIDAQAHRIGELEQRLAQLEEMMARMAMQGGANGTVRAAAEWTPAARATD